MLPKCLRIISLFADFEFGTTFGLEVGVQIITDHCPGKV